jgi:hypothetical protein
LIFAKTPATPEGLLGFVNRFGRLTAEEGADGKPIFGDNVKHMLTYVRSMSMALEMLRGQIGNLPKWPGGPFEYDLPTGHHVSGGIPLSGKLRASLAPDPVSGALQLKLQPPSLLDALWLQFGQAITSNAELRSCGQCGKWFEAGPGSGRRKDAKFCSDTCRIEFNSHKRSA